MTKAISKVKVFKFGGASVKDASSVKNVGKILSGYIGNLVVVISAMGKTTNLLETLASAYFSGSDEKHLVFDRFKIWHSEISNGLFGEGQLPEAILEFFRELQEKLEKTPSLDFNFEYDQIVCYGELVSTSLVSAWLNKNGISNEWTDIRTCLRTDDNFREAEINWDLSSKLVNETFSFAGNRIYITQGFIGSTISNLSTTLGREGSDFTAAILGNMLDAEYVAFWKDVPGILDADPEIFQGTMKIDELSYREAVEMSYSGAKVIHPKTIKPLHNKNIPLFVKSFVSPHDEGTVIRQIDHLLELSPVVILKENQVLVTLSPKDFSFIRFDSLSGIYDLFREYHIKVNLIQQSAIDFSIVFDQPETNLELFLKLLGNDFDIKFNAGLRLFTIRHYTGEKVAEIRKSGVVYLEQSSRKTARIVLK